MGKKEEFVHKIQGEYKTLREHHEKHRNAKKLLSLEKARAKALKLEFNADTIYKPKELGTHVFESYDLEEIRSYIDWTPFFQTWELHGKYPAILKDEVVGEEATRLFADAQKMLDRMISLEWIEARAVIGLFPANRVGDDIEVYADETRSERIHTVHTIRQQTEKTQAAPQIALADFIGPKEGLVDYIGGFVVSTGFGVDAQVERFEKDHDDYSSIMVKALADRMAEAFAELMHEKVRKEYWGYAVNETFDNESLIQEKYQGIRPAPGYPACPDHTEKIGLFELLGATEITGVSLTESLAMLPAASVSGWYFAHPGSKYFGVGKINNEQVEDLANRKGLSSVAMERWLSSIIS